MGTQALTDVGEQQPNDGQPTSSVRSAVHLLRVLATKAAPMGVSDLARESGLSKSTAFRLIKTLTECGMVERHGDKYIVGLGSATIGAAYEKSAGSDALSFLRELATPYLQDLFGQTRETVHLAVLDGSEVYYVDKIFGHQPARSPSRIGSRLPASCTAVGKVLLASSDQELLDRIGPGLRRLTRYSQVVPNLLVAELSRVRKDAIAFDREEAALGLLCVASPIVDAGNRTIAAVSLSGPSNRFNASVAAVAVQRAAGHISAAIRASGRSLQVDADVRVPQVAASLGA